jgi:hypothetical protein
MKKSITFLFSILFVLCISANVLAQETTGEIQGTVKDPSGAVVPNASITIRGVDVGFNRTVQTDAEGFYRARQIPPGVYNLEVGAVSGFRAQTRERILVTIGNAATVDFTLSTTEVTGQVDILATDSNVAVDPTETKVQENITAREIDNLPKGTTFSSLLRTTASTRSEPLSGQFQINGGSGSENSFIIDGQSVENFRTGVLDANNDVPYQFVQEVQVKSSGFEAEFGGATGGVVSVVTKSGTNDWRGEFGMQFVTSKLNASPRPVLSNGLTVAGTTGQFVEYFGQRKDRTTNTFPIASFGGPIIKDKFWFYGIYAPQYFLSTRDTTYVSGYPTSPAAGTSGRTVSDVITTRAKQVNEYAFIKLDANPTNTIRLSSSFTWNPIIQDGLHLGGTTVVGAVPAPNFGGNIGVLRGSDWAEQRGGRQNANNFRVEGVWTPNSKLVSTMRYARGFLNEKPNSYGIPNIPRVRCRQLVASSGITLAQTGFNGCGSTGFQNVTTNFQIVRDVSIRNTVDADVSYLISNFAGRHEFKGGYQWNKISNDVEQGYADLGVIDVYYGRTTSFPLCFGFAQAPAGLVPSPGVAGVGCMQRFGTKGKASNRNQALYIQDKWQPTDRLTLNLGLRAESEDLPAFNGQTTNLKFGWGEKLAPRIGAAFDLTGDGKTKISAFYGWFYDRLKFELPRGSFGGDFFRVDFFEIPAGSPLNFNTFNVARIRGTWNDPIGGGCPINQAGSTIRCQFDFRVPSNLPTLQLAQGAPLQPGAVDPDLKPFRQSEITVEFQRELMRSSVLTARYLYRNVDSAVEDAGFLTPTGSEFYIISNPGEGLHAQRARELGFERLAKPQRRYDALQLEYDSRFISNFQFNVNYTFSRLYGNYSGLASSDEDGRLSPGVNRFFDLPYLGFTASGQPDNGRLATDRPHVFKASGTYDFDWFGSKVNSTALTLFTQIQSGTPITTFSYIYHTPLVETRRGDLGRTETFTQTDMNLTHRYRFGRDNRFTLAFDLNVLNLLNEHNILAVDNDRTSAYYGLSEFEIAPTFREAVNILTSRGVIQQLNQSIAADPGFNLNQSYKLPSLFQGPRSVRFGFRFLF